MLDSKQQITRIAVTTGVLCCITPVGGAYALGFGDLRLRSALNQPLDARIALTSLSKSERDSLSIRIAPPDMFQRFGIERTPLVDDLQIEKSGGGPGQMILHLTSRQPVREPFLNVLVEAETSDGRALREYTLLLDPPGHPVSNSIAATRHTAPATTAPIQHGPVAQNGPRQHPAPAATAIHNGVYGPVRQGETLSEIAARLRPSGTSINQMQVALFNANPQAFDDSMNVLERGATLKVPEASTVASIDRATANDRVEAQLRRDIAVTTGDTQVAQTRKPLGEAPSPVTSQSQAGGSNGHTVRVAANSDNGLFVAPGNIGFGRLTVPDAAYWAPKPQIGVLVDNDGAKTVGPAAGASRPGDAVARASAGNELETLAAPGAGQATPDESAAAGSSAGGQSVGTAQNDRTANAADTVAQAGAAGAPQASAGDTSADQARGRESAPAVATTQATDNGFAKAGEVDVTPDAPLTATRDVASVNDAGLLSPRNILLLAGLGVLGLVALAWRRKSQYKRVPLDALGESQREAAAPVATEQTDAVAVPAPEVAETAEQATPSQRIQVAEQQIEAGEFAEARTTLEQGLAENAHETELQDKLLELDYLLGDASHFDEDLRRFDEDLRADGERQARIAAMGRVLLPGDSRFVFGQQAAAHAETASGVSPQAYSDEAVPAATTSHALEERQVASGSNRSVGIAQSGNTGRRWSDRPLHGTNDDAANELLDAETPEPPVVGAEHEADEAGGPAEPTKADLTDATKEQTALPDDADSGSLRLDTTKSDLSEYEWQASEIDTTGERQHDKGDEPGLAFDAESADLSDTQSPEPIDTSGFDLDDSPDTDENEADEDPVAVRLDLARMYLEMEDDSAARPLLEEALDTGDESQRDDARTLLDKLG